MLQRSDELDQGEKRSQKVERFVEKAQARNQSKVRGSRKEGGIKKERCVVTAPGYLCSRFPFLLIWEKRKRKNLIRRTLSCTNGNEC